MSTPGKKSQSLSIEDQELIDYLSIKGGAKIYHFIKMHHNPKEHAKQLSKNLKSNKNSSLVIFLLNLDLLEKDGLYSPQKLLNIATRSLTKESEIEKFVNDSTWSKALKVLTGDKIIVNVRDKVGFKKYKQNKRITFDTEGRYSRYYTSPTVEKVKSALSNPIIIDCIHDRLKRSGFLDDFLTYYFEVALYILNYNNTEMSMKTFGDFLKSIDDSSQIEKTEWESFRRMLSMANDEIIKRIARLLVIDKRVFDNYSIQKPLYSILLLFALVEV